MKNTPINLGILCLLLLQVYLPAARAALINDVDFTTYYSASSNVRPNAATGVSPNETPNWTSAQNGTATSTVSNNIMTLYTTASDNLFYTMGNTNPQNWNGAYGAGTLGTTIEFSLKVDAQTGSTGAVQLIFAGATTQAFSMLISANKITLATASNGSGVSYTFDTTSDFHTYRLTQAGDGSSSINLYIDNNSVPIISGYSGYDVGSTSNLIRFGDFSGSVGGTSEWEYIAFTNAGAFAPVPEPGSLALISLGSAALAFGICRRKKS